MTNPSIAMNAPSPSLPARWTDASLPIPAGLLCVRKARAEDASAFVRYWASYTPARLDMLGVDAARLGSAGELRERFLRLLPAADLSDQHHAIFSLWLGDALIGYSNINRHAPWVNYCHLHLYPEGIRQALRAARRPAGRRWSGEGAGLAAFCAGLVMSQCLGVFGMPRVTAQTRTRNVLINRALDFYMPPDETQYFEQPDGLSLPGHFHLRHFHAERREEYLRRAEELALSEVPA
ncbi:hypothetical protein [Paracidovorax avenae]|uniref:hypothetical protein n=1 Tax=Paracidovorax avenae TaxID=80867 RepID=UPI000D2205E5|nr:hypothetical protein [Paracidovorax avenae]AVS95158.1 N-acetyltransferase [Paracidovorax avenae]AVT01824.1 N-acetyltransferase [Paracidovorax avenae]AVT05275.1 N-acetyltransferase [Paracidovorax avenae]AVT08734.1 N-acetyltransferase [Paracidovorax avenae]AVT12102.1 N-acetyltransferase [Paracidovorax avenae]